MVQREKAGKKETAAKPGKSHRFNVERVPVGQRDLRRKYLIHFVEMHSREEVLGVMFSDGTLPEGCNLEERRGDVPGLTWEFTTPEGGIDIATKQKMTELVGDHFRGSVLHSTSDETAAYRAGEQAFMDSRPPYLPGQSVREAFAECRDNKATTIMGPSCWARRAGFFYYIGWDSSRGGRVLQVRTSPQTAEVIRNWEWYLSKDGRTLHEAARLEEEWQTQKLRAVIFAYACALCCLRRDGAPDAPAPAGRCSWGKSPSQQFRPARR